ncbi:cytoplasmic dynein 2 intermediate chain 1 [Drosophila montana]|uniref:cytoplasmic dynein 2 intermediate chain 1 n=1 Tax=Drosophila montana TaxID=40370 RepID=UPI00313E06D5
MSKSSTRTATKTNPKNETHRKAINSPATGVGTATSRSSSKKVKQQDSIDSESLRKATKTAKATVTATTTKKPPPLHTSKNKEREAVPQTSKRATPSPATKATSTLRAAKQPPASKAKTNAVLDTYHSVTVSSPPQKRRVQPKQATAGAGPVDTVEEDRQPPRARSYSRTLQPEEVVVLKRESAKQRSELEVLKQIKQVKQPVAFEVNFEAAKKQAVEAKNELDNYSDDFESYESDFETDASTPEEEELEEDEIRVAESEEAELLAAEVSLTVDSSDVDDDEDSEPTQNPITVIQRDKELERKLDSGHYDMHSRRQPRAAAQQPYDSFDTNSMANSDQLDSGISSYGVAAAPEVPIVRQSTADVHYGGYVDFVARPVITRRGLELMRKLRFDQLDYQLFEMKPLSYEGYMQSYGKLNTCQLATQTHSQHMDNECQTLELHMRTSWTQHPPYYGSQLVLSCSGDAGSELDMLSAQTNDPFESSLARLEQLRQAEQHRTLQQQRQRLAKPNDLERLGVFLNKASLLLGKVLNTKCPTRSPRHVPLLQTGLLNALRVRRIFGSSGQQQLVVTVHECPPQSDVYRDDFANLLMVWSLTDPSKPLRLLSTWAEVCRVTFCSEAPDIIVAGLRDGSMAMWDLRETYSYCSKLDGNLTHFAATQSVVPNMDTKEFTALDLGAVVEVRSFRPAPKSSGIGLESSLALTHKDIQYAALNDSGLLTIWTLVESGLRGYGAGSPNEYSSPWARVKLLQAASCDLRGYLERRLLKRNQTAYDKTKSLFQGNIYSDELLRELNETQTLTTAFAGQGLQGLRFSSIDTGSDLIYVCTNRNFVLCCTRSLKPERFTRIGLHESRFLFPTALCVLANEYFVAVGLSNGSVIILNCNQRQRQRLQRPTTAMPQPTIEHEPETGKSCAIQNIILNERRSFDQKEIESSASGNYDARPNTALQLLQQPRRSYELLVFDQQLLLSGSVLRQHLVQSLVQSSDGWRLFALANGSVRTYDFHLDRELTDAGLEISSPVADIAASSSSSTNQQLLVLAADGKVHMHSVNL